MAVLNPSRPMAFALITTLSLIVLLSQTGVVKGAIACNETHNPCEELLYKGSECRDGFCSNPFEKGCLNTLLNEEFGEDNELLPSLARRLQRQIRVCNSEDPPEARGVICIDHQSEATSASGHSGDSANANLYSDYTEVRILSQNWESAFFASWVMQILLTELLQVPTTIETGTRDAKLNFYSPTNEFGYGKNNDWGAIETANAAPYGDCRLVEKGSGHESTAMGEGAEEEYVACGHVIPEFWSGGYTKDLWARQKDGDVDLPEGLGAIGQQGIYVTKFTALQEPTVLNLLGIGGEGNRRKMAELFNRPTTWKEYCEIVSTTNCTVPDGVAERPPKDESEYNRYHVAGYKGHFRPTEKNDCDKNPTTCTGHVADFPCGWASYLAVQIHHHNMPLESDGPEEGSNGYSYGQLVELYAAANATKSNFMTMWWQPEALYSTYLNTDAEMQRIVMPSPTQECVDNRIRTGQRCDYANDEERYGDPAGACDEAAQLLQKIVGASLYKSTYDNPAIPKARLSPAYDAIKAFKMNELQQGNILQQWIYRNVDTYGFDPRFATCQWVRDNLDFLEDFIPRSYPRVAQEQDISKSPLFYVAVSFGVVSAVLTIVVTVFTYRRRNGYVMRFSQWEFLLLLLLGLLLVSGGSILLAIPPNNGSCVAIQWLVGIGYTLELVPLIVKVGAMNRLMTAAKKMKRIVLTRRHLFGTVALFMSVMAIFLILWSAIDTPQRKGEYTLTDDMTEDGEQIVKVGYYCSSDSDAWRYVAVVWHCILLAFATVLAFQTRNLQTGFSESSVLAIIIYSHFVFVLLRVLTFLLGGVLLESQVAGFRSLIYSTDAIVTLCVYFIPKLLTDDDTFYALTHPVANQQREGGRGSVVTVMPEIPSSGNFGGRGSVITMNTPSSLSAPLSKQFANDSDSESDSFGDDEDQAMSLPANSMHRSNHSSKSAMKNSKKPKDALNDNRVSWGGMAFTTVLKSVTSGASCVSDADEEEELVPFEKPVDVLKGANSWGGAHVTQLIHSEEDQASTTGEESGEMGAIAEETEHESSDVSARKSLLAAPSLPKDPPKRFSYASSRITRTRKRHNVETYDEANPV